MNGILVMPPLLAVLTEMVVVEVIVCPAIASRRVALGFTLLKPSIGVRYGSV
ncbi:hypothetical protein D3C87_2201290 [compost metagenome]